jgi:hypothetical protein
MRPIDILGTDTVNVVVTGAGVVVAAIAAVVAWIARGDSKRAGDAAEQANKVAEKANEIAEKALDAVERQASVAERALALSVRPVIVGDPKPERPFSYRTEPNDEDNSAHRGDFAFYISFPIRNLGVGPALLLDAYIETTSNGKVTNGSGHGGVLVKVNRAVIAKGESALFYALIPQLTGNAVQIRKDIEANGFFACIRYTDVSEDQRTLTAIRLTPQPATKDLRMNSVDLFACDRDWSPSRSALATDQDPLTHGALD